MKKKAVIQLTYKKEKHRSTALKVVVSAHKSCKNIESVGWKGESNEVIEVVGDGVDIIKLVELIRKKLGGAEIVSLAPADEKKKSPENHPPPPYQYWVPPQNVILYDPYYHNSSPGCCIL